MFTYSNIHIYTQIILIIYLATKVPIEAAPIHANIIKLPCNLIINGDVFISMSSSISSTTLKLSFKSTASTSKNMKNKIQKNEIKKNKY